MCDKNPGSKDHCYHETDRALTSYPAQCPEVCCWCGEKRIRKESFIFDYKAHGEFLPYFGATHNFLDVTITKEID